MPYRGAFPAVSRSEGADDGTTIARGVSVFSAIFMAFGLASKPAAGEEVVVSAIAFTVLAWLVTRPGARAFAWLATAATVGAMVQQAVTEDRWIDDPSLGTFVAASLAPLAVVFAGGFRARATLTPIPPLRIDVAVCAVLVTTCAVGALAFAFGVTLGDFGDRRDIVHITYGAFAVGSVATVVASVRFGKPLFLVLLLSIAVGTVAAFDDSIIPPHRIDATDHMVLAFFWMASAVAVLFLALVTLRTAATRTAADLDQVEVATNMIASAGSHAVIAAIATLLVIFFSPIRLMGAAAGGLTLLLVVRAAGTFMRFRPSLEHASLHMKLL